MISESIVGITETASPASPEPSVAPVGRLAIVGNYVPRLCGIATFTTDLCEAIAAAYTKTSCFAIPVNDRPEGYEYPDRVRFELSEDDLASYRRAADFLNLNHVDVVCLQHEYGIFGGRAGSHILALLRELRMPVVTTLHTILDEPDPAQRQVLEELADLSDRLIVMSRHGSSLLQEIYRIPAEKIDYIPHGIPDVPFVDPNFYKDQFGVEGKIVLLTFGLLSANKGIEHLIDALPAVLERHPNVVYLVVGATHPHVRAREGESYRLALERQAQKRGVSGNVIFRNSFVTLEELLAYIGAADIYITPYLNRRQIVSGTLSYAVGAGKAVVSTPYWYAEELLAEGRGVLVPFADPAALSAAIIRLLDHEGERHAMRKRAYLLGRQMIWRQVARQYMQSFDRARAQRAQHPRSSFVACTLARRPGELPELKLDHLERMTDSTGLLQHAVFTIPNYNEGYTTDDNARALIVGVLAEVCRRPLPATPRYLAFLWHAFHPAAQRFRNVLSYDRRWLDDVGPEDCHGRALWSLGTVLGKSNDPGLRGVAGRLFDQALPAVLTFTSPRAWAFTLFGIHEYLKLFAGDRAAQGARTMLGERLLGLYHQVATEDWPWFEEILSYCNAVLPHALMLWAKDTEKPEAFQAALRALQWLASVQCPPPGHFVPVGSNGFYRRGGDRARFDQQPIEAQAMVSACLDAYRLTQEPRWRHYAQRAFEWFLGENDLNAPLYDPATGGCRDGLHPDRANQNEGAESTLAFLHSLLEMSLAEHVIDARLGSACEAYGAGARNGIPADAQVRSRDAEAA
jgi:glycosyltransferase involved in cell wall biosynthesis